MSEAKRSIHEAERQPMARRLVSARIWTLLISLRLSADAAHRRAVQLPELDRRLLLAIGGGGAATPSELVGGAGQDKAQVSRALKRLSEGGLIDRKALRGPIGLSAEGEALAGRMRGLAERRNRALLSGIDAAEEARFRATVARLTDRATLLFAEEKRLGGDADAAVAATVRPPAREAGETLLTPLLMTLLIYLQRSAALSYRRLTGLSGFDWQVLAQVVEHAPLALARLVLMLGRDKGQAGRTVARLEAIGLVARSRTEGRRAVLLEPTREGRDVYRSIADEALRRNAALIEAIAPAELAGFLATLDTLTANAERLGEVD